MCCTDMYDQFVEMVAAGRHMQTDQVRQLADGRAYTGRQARTLGLIDEIGGEAEAREWLAREKGISTELPIEDVSPGGFTERALHAALGPITERFGKTLIGQVLSLDGGWALWQPATQ